MKKVYEHPRFEVVEFRFSEHIAAGSGCDFVWDHAGVSSCDTGTPTKTYYNDN